MKINNKNMEQRPLIFLYFFMKLEQLFANRPSQHLFV